MAKTVFISVSKAIEIAAALGIKISRVTVIKHADGQYGHQIGGKGGKWAINKEKFRRFIHGENKGTTRKSSKAGKKAIQQKDPGNNAAP